MKQDQSDNRQVHGFPDNGISHVFDTQVASSKLAAVSWAPFSQLFSAPILCRSDAPIKIFFKPGDLVLNAVITVAVSNLFPITLIFHSIKNIQISCRSQSNLYKCIDSVTSFVSYKTVKRRCRHRWFLAHFTDAYRRCEFFDKSASEYFIAFPNFMAKSYKICWIYDKDKYDVQSKNHNTAECSKFCYVVNGIDGE